MSLQLQNNRKTATGSRRWFSKTLMAAYVVLGLVLWQTIHVGGGGEMPFKRSAKPQMGSTKLHADRDAQVRKNRATKEPVAAFFERAKRGMTEQEIRGMIADFEAIGPGPTSGELVDKRDYAKKLNDWYFKTLDEGLSLSHEQKQAVWVSLTDPYNGKSQDWKSSLSDVMIEHLILLPQINLSRNLRLYSPNSGVNPWNLCDLTEAQLMLTYKKSLEAKHEARDREMTDARVKNPNASIAIYPVESLLMHDPTTGEYIDYLTPSPSCMLIGSVSGGIIDVTNTFPLTPDQKLENHRNDFLVQAKLLHPAQLRMALMMKPSIVYAIKSALDKPLEQ